MLKKATLSLAILAVVANVQAQDMMLEEVIVTAQKRSQSLQDVPISITAMTGESLDQYNITNVADLSSSIPNLTATDGVISNAIYIRGVGTGANQGFEQSVGTFVDGVYRGRAALASTAFFDLERIEVLRGPQGVLFGKSVIGGAISSTTAKPTEEFEAKVTALYEPEYNSKEVQGIVSGGLTDSLSGRLAVRGYQSDGFMENTTLNKDQPSKDDQTIRGSLVWDMSDTVTATLQVEHSQFEQDGLPLQLSGSDAGGKYAGETSFDLKRSAGSEEFRDTEVNNVILTLDASAGDYELKSITGYSAYDYRDALDADGGSVSPLSKTDADILQSGGTVSTRSAYDTIDQFGDEEYEQWSQEFRIVSPGGETIDWLAGAYFDYSELSFSNDTDLDLADSLSLLYDRLPQFTEDQINQLATYGLASSGRDFYQEAYTAAAFGQGTWNIQDNLRATLGLRYTYEKKKAERKVGIDYYKTTDAITNPTSILIWETVLQAERHDNQDSFTDKYVTPSLNVQWDYSDENMAYISFSQGQKSGGFDVKGNYSSATQPWQFEPEKATSYELGTKMRLLEGAAELNAAIFYTDYTDLQTSSFDGGTGYYVINAGEATIQGVEVDGRWLVAEGLTLNGSVGYLDFNFDEFEDGPCNASGSTPPSTGDSCDLSGMENIYTPEFSASLGFDYSQFIASNLMWRVSGNASFTDNQYTAFNLDPNSESAAYTLYDMTVALTDAEGDWSVAVIGKNLSDVRRATFTSDTPLTQGYESYNQVTLAPRTVALQGIYNF